eukprot:scaffold440_cov155-Pinguiococcus_pyrenoidosus.AAC.1
MDTTDKFHSRPHMAADSRCFRELRDQPSDAHRSAPSARARLFSSFTQGRSEVLFLGPFSPIHRESVAAPRRSSPPPLLPRGSRIGVGVPTIYGIKGLRRR